MVNYSSNIQSRSAMMKCAADVTDKYQKTGDIVASAYTSGGDTLDIDAGQAVKA